MLSVLLWVLVLALLLGAGALCAARVRRLHRLHVRTDAARAGLDAALRRRAAVAASAVSAAGAARDEWDSRRNLCDESAVRRGARAAGGVVGLGADREAAENALGRALSRVDRDGWPAAVRVELADAERLVVLGRHVHNDAVRDTLALRSRRLVRWLRLAGTAPMPTYFEIAVPPPVTCAATPDLAPPA